MIGGRSSLLERWPPWTGVRSHGEAAGNSQWRLGLGKAEQILGLLGFKAFGFEGLDWVR